jgi:monoamine oxidase
MLQPVGGMDKIHFDYSSFVERWISVSWPKIPYQTGAWGVSQPNYLLQGDGNIYFAGEHLSILQGWQEGAVLSAYSAIEQIVNRL